MDELIPALFSIASSDPKKFKRLKDFDATGKRGIRRLFEEDNLRQGFGNLIDSDNCPVLTACNFHVVLESNGKQIEFVMDGPPATNRQDI